MGFFTGMLDRIRGSGVSVVDYHGIRARHRYWVSNSIYLDNIYNKIATDVAMMRFKHIRITRQVESADQTEWFEHSDLATVCGVSPNVSEAPFVFWANVVRTMLMNQVAVVVPVMNGASVERLQLVDGKVGITDDDLLVVSIDGVEHRLSVDDVWVFENPKRNISSQLGQITRLIDDNLAALSSRLNGDDSVRGLLKLPTRAATADVERRMQVRLDSFYATAKSGGVSYLEQGEEFQELKNAYGDTVSEQELAFLKAQLYHAFGINEQLFTADYSEQQYRAYFQSVVKVYMRVIAEEINRKAFTKTKRTQGHRMMVYMDLFDVASLRDLNEFMFKQKYSGNFNSNELREMFGYGGYEGGDVFETNKNAVRLGEEQDGTVTN